MASFGAGSNSSRAGTATCKVVMEFHFYKDAYDMLHICTIFCEKILLDETSPRWEYDIFYAWIVSQCIDDTGIEDITLYI